MTYRNNTMMSELPLSNLWSTNLVNEACGRDLWKTFLWFQRKTSQWGWNADKPDHPPVRHARGYKKKRWNCFAGESARGNREFLFNYCQGLVTLKKCLEFWTWSSHSFNSYIWFFFKWKIKRLQWVFWNNVKSFKFNITYYIKSWDEKKCVYLER